MTDIEAYEQARRVVLAHEHRRMAALCEAIDRVTREFIGMHEPDAVRDKAWELRHDLDLKPPEDI
jgi:hypothetical protein